MSSDSWPALHGRPVLRRTIAMGLVLFVAVMAALAVRGVNALTLGRGVVETDRDRAELLAGLHPSQHPGAGRYYVPVGAVYTHTPDGVPVAYLHYRLGGGREVGVGDFLRTYDLPAPGPTTALPPDLTEALGGDEPDLAAELFEPLVTASADPSADPSVDPSAGSSAPVSAGTTPAPAPVHTSDGTGPVPTGVPTEMPASEATVEAGLAAGPEEEPDGFAPAFPADVPDPAQGTPSPSTEPSPTSEPSPTPAPEQSPTGPAATATPARPSTVRRIYVATVPGGLPGAADIYVRATTG
ncbi:hypothetical protein PUR61_21335 [Streptomyces sp. BE20]|uniref:hypothetical protein n=1 Tax=Streptomyces sp. BE20 TaxID=3002525 RepID=UPI002E76B92D|nr:hypothetical protein [Streptomyces sp. BE20]MEE1824702.1 hypothetical protein [Streptomyces sp. BE20]